MDTKTLKKLSKQQLTELLLKIKQKPATKPVAVPRKSVKQMVEKYEDNKTEPPLGGV